MKLFLSYTPIQYFSVNMAISYMSKRYYDNITNWLSIPDYTLFDIGIQSKPINYATIWFKVNNLFDKNYLSTFDQPQAGREFRIGLTLDFKVARK
jgi:outer membrane receptor protein involved in Fe transport